jgi:putative transposase
MPRGLRVEYAGAIYHVMNRGNRRERIFRGPADFELVLKTLDEAWTYHTQAADANDAHAEPNRKSLKNGQLELRSPSHL